MNTVNRVKSDTDDELLVHEIMYAEMTHISSSIKARLLSHWWRLGVSPLVQVLFQTTSCDHSRGLRMDFAKDYL